MIITIIITVIATLALAFAALWIKDLMDQLEEAEEQAAVADEYVYSAKSRIAALDAMLADREEQITLIRQQLRKKVPVTKKRTNAKKVKVTKKKGKK